MEKTTLLPTIRNACNGITVLWHGLPAGCRISVGDFVNLQLGDIIRLDRKVDDELEVYVGNIKKFAALPGYSEDKYAIRITEVIKEESE